MGFYISERLSQRSPTSEEAAIEYVEDMYYEIEAGNFEENSSEYLTYSYSLANYILLELSDSDDLSTEIDTSDLEYTFAVVSAIGAFTNEREIFHQGRYSSLKERSLSPYFECIDQLNTRFGSDLKEKIAQAISYGIEAVENHPDNLYVLYQFAESVRIGLDEVGDFDEIESRISVERDELLAKAIPGLEQAIRNHPGQFSTERAQGPFVTISMCHAVLAHLQAYSQDFDAARSSLNKSRTEYVRQQYNFDLEKVSNISTKIDALSLEENVLETQSQLNNIQQELQNTTERFRSDIIQYIAFFSGVITIAVVSAQVTQITSSFEDAARLILVFTGGVMVAFSGFGLMLPYKLNRGEVWFRFILIFLMGVAIILFGIDPFNIWSG